MTFYWSLLMWFSIHSFSFVLRKAPSRYFKFAKNGGSTNLDSIRKQDFPLLGITHHTNPLVYLDSAATSHKPITVINSISSFYSNNYSNVHRSNHFLGVQATNLYEESREEIKSFINAPHLSNIIFTHGATESINMAASILENHVEEGDEIILSIMEHHSNIIPWQILAQKKHLKLKYIQLNLNNYTLNISHFQSLFTPRTKIVSVAHVSNVLGTINQISLLANITHQHNAIILVDASQAIGHIPIDVQTLDVDMLFASGHKMLGPDGIGLLYMKDVYDLPTLPLPRQQRNMKPFLTGGHMAESVDLYSSTYSPIPHRYEAGTPPIAAAIGFAAACRYISTIGVDRIYKHTILLGDYLYQQLKGISNVVIYGPEPNITYENRMKEHHKLSSRVDLSHNRNSISDKNNEMYSGEDAKHFKQEKLIEEGEEYDGDGDGEGDSDGAPRSDRVGIVSFAIEGISSSDVMILLSEYNIAIRHGYHCAQPLHRYLGIENGGSLRASVYIYNDKRDIDIFIHRLKEVIYLLSNSESCSDI